MWGWIASQIGTTDELAVLHPFTAMYNPGCHNLFRSSCGRRSLGIYLFVLWNKSAKGVFLLQIHFLAGIAAKKDKWIAAEARGGATSS